MSTASAPDAHAHPAPPFAGSLLDEIAPPAGPAPQAAAPAVAARRRVRLPAPLARLWARRPLRYATLALLLLALGVGVFLWLRPRPQPDYALDPMEDVLDYTLLSEDFNHLPIDQRLKLLADLINRLKTMSGDDSAAMAAFAAAINSDRLRAQIEENASRLALDMWDKYALDYQAKPADSRGQYLDDVLLNMMKMMDTVAGVQSDKTDEQRLAEAREQARRDREALQSGKGPSAGQLARMADLMRNRVGSHSSPQQQQRGMQLMRDMTRHLRGQDPETGKPVKK
jgi:hypothetical protein